MYLDWMQSVLDDVKEGNLSLYRQFLPKRYVPPQEYLNPKYYSASLLAMLLDRFAIDVSKDKTKVLSYAMGFELAKYQFPTFFVDEMFLRAVLASEPPEDYTIAQIQFPFPSLLFVLPQKFMREYTGFGVPFLSASKFLEPEIRLPDLAGGYILDNKEGNDVGGFAFHWMGFFTLNPAHYIFHHKLKLKISEVVNTKEELVDYGETMPFYGAYKEIVYKNELPTVQQEKQMTDKMNALAIKLLLVMSASNSLVMMGNQIRKARIKHNKLEKDALWNPNFIGKGYRAKREGFREGEGVSPRCHWRRGFIRNQAFGKKFSEHKPIWIEPVLVNAD